jgi:hypothetical protein
MLLYIHDTLRTVLVFLLLVILGDLNVLPRIFI